ncbi:MAG: Rpn family recombination-promoting nuclease/putative transposase [Eubacteriaceae bacterium]|nr:Rpn family recombination-promoting nuclease/putative transposase [Eubacteriaceae bacterium]
MDEATKLPRLPYTHDLIFSICFQEESAKSIINATFGNDGRTPISNITEIRKQDVFTPQEYGGRGSRLDVTASDGGGNLFNIEVQVNPDKAMLRRSMFYSSNMLVRAAAGGKKFSFGNLPSVTVINILNFVIRENDPGFYQPIVLAYKNGAREIADDLLTIYNIELPKFRATVKLDISNPLHRWLYYLDNGYLYPDDKIVREVISMDTGIRRYEEEYRRRISDPDLLVQYQDYLYNRMVAETQLDQAREESKAEGRSEGKAEGIAEGSRVTLLNSIDVLYKSGLNKAQLKAYAISMGLSPDEWKKIAESYPDNKPPGVDNES